MYFRAHTKVGRLVIGAGPTAVIFTTVPALYEFEPGEEVKIRMKWGDRLVMELIEDLPEFDDQSMEGITGPMTPSGRVMPPKEKVQGMAPGEPGYVPDPAPEFETEVGASPGPTDDAREGDGDAEPPQGDAEATNTGTAAGVPTDGVPDDGPPTLDSKAAGNHPDSYDCPQCDVRHKRDSGIGREHAHLVTAAVPEGSVS